MKEIKFNNLEEIVYEFTALGGLKVYIWPSKLSEEVNATLTVNYGSIHNDFKINNKTYHMPKGMAHFLEHIKFNEKKDFTAHDFYNKLGSYVNAYTTFNHTCYETVFNEKLKENLEHLLYFVYNPYFTNSLINKEKGIIISESKMSLDNPYSVGYNKLLNNLFVNDDKKYYITGLPEDIKQITMEHAKCVFENFYHPENMFLIVTGNVNVFEVEKIVNDYFKNKKISKYKRPSLITIKDEDKVNKKEDEMKLNVVKDKLLIAFKIPKKYFKEYDDLRLRMMFDMILKINFGATSEFQEYLIKNELIDGLYPSFFLEENHLCIMFETSTDYPEKLKDLIIEKFKKLEILKQEFIRKKRSILSKMILDFEDPIGVNGLMRNYIVQYKKIINDESDIYNNIKYEDIINLTNKIKKYDITYLYLKPKEKSSD